MRGAQEIEPLLRAIESFAGHIVTRDALRLAPHVCVRPGELRYAEWIEIDVENAMWSIPAAKMKMRRPHRVPLARQSLAILAEMREVTGKLQYVFPGFQTLSATHVGKRAQRSPSPAPPPAAGFRPTHRLRHVR